MVTKTISWMIDLGSSYINISNYVENVRFPVTCSRGMRTGKEGDNVAQTGVLTLYLINDGGLFDPESDVPYRIDISKGTVIEMQVLYTNRTFKRFRGHVDNIVFGDISTADNICTVTIFDFMDYVYNTPLSEPQIQLDKTGDVAVNALIAEIPIQPQSTNIQTGSYIYPAIFDTATTGTKISTEIQKLCNSEGSYFYIRCDPLYGEVVVWENGLNRNGLVTAKQLPETLADSKYLIDHLGRRLTDRPTGGSQLKANESCNCVLGDEIKIPERSNGQIYNKVTIRAFPKKTDTTDKVLYTLDSPITLGSGETKTFKGRYTNPTESTSTQVNAVDTSMSVTSYTMNTAIDGSGTNISGGLIVTAVFYSSYPEFTVYNNSSYLGYVTSLTASGLGVYQDNPIDFSLQDTVSQNLYGLYEYQVDQQYQRDIAPGSQLVAGILEENKYPHTRLEKITFQADRSDELMIAFLNVDIGDMIQITNAGLYTDSYFFIQGIEFTIEKGDLITFTWILKKFENLVLGLSGVAVEFNASSTDAIRCGNVQKIVNADDISISAWIYLTSTAHVQREIVSAYIQDIGGLELYVLYDPGTSKSSLSFRRLYTGVPAVGEWYTGNVIAQNTWVLLSISKDSGIANPATFYMNGLAMVVVVGSAPGGGLGSINGMDFCIGNIHGVGADPVVNYGKPFAGKIKDVRVWDKTLNATEHALLYSQGVYGTGVTDGLVLQPLNVRTKQLDYYTDHILLSNDRLIDNIYGAISTPNGSPVTRLP
jgi:hypothetical protein